MVIFNSYVKLPEGIHWLNKNEETEKMKTTAKADMDRNLRPMWRVACSGHFGFKGIDGHLRSQCVLFLNVHGVAFIHHLVPVHVD